MAFKQFSVTAINVSQQTSGLSFLSKNYFFDDFYIKRARILVHLIDTIRYFGTPNIGT